jgi:hypothetical protein
MDLANSGRFCIINMSALPMSARDVQVHLKALSTVFFSIRRQFVSGARAVFIVFTCLLKVLILLLGIEIWGRNMELSS